LEVDSYQVKMSAGRGRSSDSAESCRAVSIEARPEVRPRGAVHLIQYPLWIKIGIRIINYYYEIIF